MKLKKIAKHVGALGIACGLTIASFSAAAADTIKVGVLHSLSGTMAISETTLKDTVLMLIEEQNKKAVCSVKNWKPLLLTQRQTGHCLPKKPASC